MIKLRTNILLLLCVWVATILLTCLDNDLSAKNIDLVTLPRREKVQLTIYNSVDLTLATEIRYVTLKKGMNQLQFSWAGTLIDPTSVEIRPLEHKDSIDVVDTLLPAQKPQHLIWNIQSDIEGPNTIISGSRMSAAIANIERSERLQKKVTQAPNGKRTKMLTSANALHAAALIATPCNKPIPIQYDVSSSQSKNNKSGPTKKRENCAKT